MRLHAATLVLSALQSPETAAAWLESNASRMRVYNGFNLLLGDVVPVTNGDSSVEPRWTISPTALEAPARTLAPGVYGLSNAVARYAVAEGHACSHAHSPALSLPEWISMMLVRLLENRELARDSELPSTGVPYEWERALSSIQIRANGYGTRATTVITVRNDGLTTFLERTYDTSDPQRLSDRHYEFTIDRASSLARIKAPGPS